MPFKLDYLKCSKHPTVCIKFFYDEEVFLFSLIIPKIKKLYKYGNGHISADSRQCTYYT